MLLQIERVDQVAPPAVKANYTIYEFMCSGWVEGEYTAQIKVQTLSGKEADFVQPGWAGQATADEKFGLHYKIETPANGVDGQGKAQGLQAVRNSQQAQAPNPAPPSVAPPGAYSPPPPGAKGNLTHVQPAPPQQGKVTFVSLMDGYTTCLQAAEHIIEKAGYEDSVPFADIHAVACTLFIQAQRGGVHIPAPREAKAEAPPAPQQAPPAPEPAPPAPAPHTPEETEAIDEDDLPF